MISILFVYMSVSSIFIVMYANYNTSRQEKELKKDSPKMFVPSTQTVKFKDKESRMLVEDDSELAVN